MENGDTWISEQPRLFVPICFPSDKQTVLSRLLNTGSLGFLISKMVIKTSILFHCWMNLKRKQRYEAQSLAPKRYLVHFCLLSPLAVIVSVAKPCLTLCDPRDCSPPGCSVHGISQAKILEWVAISFSRTSSRPRDRTHVSCIPGGFLSPEKPYFPFSSTRINPNPNI